MKQLISPTWIIFASGNSVKVELSLYDPVAERNRPIEAYMVSDVGSDLARSASRAAEAIYAIAHTAKIAPPPTVVGYDLQGLGSGSQIAGQSSGLALALALAKKLWPDSDPGPIAATGEIAGSSNGGPLHKIAEIEAKGKAVLALLPDGGYFFYPKDNDAEISKALKQLWCKNGIKAQAVNSVVEALASFIPAIADHAALKPELAASMTIPEEGRRPSSHLLIVLALIVVIAAAGLFYANFTPYTVSPSSKIADPSININQVDGKAETNVLKDSAQKGLAPVQKTDQSSPQAVVNTGPINPVNHSLLPTPIVKTADQTLVAQDFPEITLTGTSGLANRLARRTGALLKAFLDSDRNLPKQLLSLDGRIEMIEIRERWDSQSDSLSSTVTTAFHGHAALKNGEQFNIKLEPITVSGNSPMRQQLSHAATLMVDRITKKLYLVGNLKREKQSAPIKPANKVSKGFE